MADPILWAHKTQRTRRLIVDGEVRIERLPQRGHRGDSDYDRPQPVAGPRWIHVVKNCGSAVRVPITNGASLVVGGGPDGTYSSMIDRKAKALGWYSLASCPCALLQVGDLQPHHLASRDLLTAQPCPPRSYSEDNPCPHALAEQEARRAKHEKREAERNKGMQSEAEKLLVAQKEQTKEIVSGITDAVASIAAAMQQKETSTGKGRKDS